MLLRVRTTVDWVQIRRRMLRETEEYITDGLQHPEHTIRIPVLVVGKGRFSLNYARVFWERMLRLSESSRQLSS